jgi:hypothetical protein
MSLRVFQLASSLLLATIVAACGSLGQPDVTPPVVSTPSADSLTAVLQTFMPTQRLEWADLTAACRDRPTCTGELAVLRAALAARCPTAADCQDPVARLLYVQRSPEQRAAGLYPADLASAAAVLTAWSATRAPDGG